jgi:ribosome biogenesis protein Nip4
MTREERTIVNRSLDKWGAFDALKHNVFLVRQEGASRKLCLVSPEMEPIVLQKHPCLSGLVIGEITKQFIPTLQGVDLFFRVGGKSQYYIKINENAENLVLYGRDVMGDSIIEAPEVLAENSFVAILNVRGEVIGVGRTRLAGRLLFQKGRITVTTISDAGLYLRDEDEEKRSKLARHS